MATGKPRVPRRSILFLMAFVALFSLLAWIATPFVRHGFAPCQEPHRRAFWLFQEPRVLDCSSCHTLATPLALAGLNNPIPPQCNPTNGSTSISCNQCHVTK